MIAKLIADALVVLHFLFIIFVIFGGFSTLKWPRIALIHIPCAIWGALIEFYGWVCPLTHFEHYFRETASGVGYSGGFIQHYLIPIIYPYGLTKDIQLGLGIMVVSLNLFIYLIVIYKKVRHGTPNDSSYGP